MAVTHINLPDPKAAGPGQTELNYLSILIVMAVTIVGCCSYILWQKYNLNSVQKELNSLTTEVARLNLTVSSKYKNESGDDVLSKLGHPISWSKLLKKVVDIIPARTRLSQINGSLANPRNLVLVGNTTAPHFAFALKNSLFEFPECEKARVSNLNQSVFQIECQIR